MADLPVHFMDEFAVDVCAVCLSPIGEETEQSDEEAFLDNCYHRFHQQVRDPLDFARIYQEILCWFFLLTRCQLLQCVMSWTAAQKAHPTLGSLYTCPLCKAPYTSVLHSFHDNIFRYHSTSERLINFEYVEMMA